MVLDWIRRSGVVVSAMVLVLAVGCSDTGQGTDPDNQNQFDEDVGVDDTGVDDVGPPEEVGPDADPDPDADTGLDADVAQDTEGDADADDDGPVDGEGDNCPEISNPDQADRSRDGIGDACANFPYFHDPTNPEYLEIIYEDEGLPNDDFWDAQQNWMLDVPLVIEGGIDPAGDIDYYSLSVDEPTTLLFHVEQLTSTSNLWPIVIVMGGFLENFEFGTVLYADNQGESLVQDVHLPIAGEYHFIISDYYNLTTGGGNTGGDDYGYRISVSAPPLPDALPLTYPTPRQLASYDDRVAATYTIDVSNGDALKVTATGAPRNQLSVMYPAIQFLDAHTGEVLAYTLEDQVETDAMRSELALKVGDVDEVLVVVEAHAALGENDLVMDFEVFDKPEHLETPDNPRQGREDHLLWMRPGSFIESMIGPPVPVADDALAPDVDYFMMMTNPGDFFRLSVEPIAPEQLMPEVAIGRFSAAGSYWTWHEGGGASQAGDTDSLSALITGDDHRDSAIRVLHIPNTGNSLPVGGPNYRYELHVESLDWQEEAENHDQFPASIPVVLEAGEQGLYHVEFQPGYDYSISYNGNFNRRLEIVDTETWEVLESTTGSTGYFARPDQEVVLAVRDRNGDPIADTEGIIIDITEGQGPQDIDIPATVEGQLDATNSLDVFEATLSQGELVEVRTAATLGTAPQIDVIGESVNSVTSEDGTMALARAEDDGSVIVVVERSTTVDVEYTLGIHVVDPTEAEAPHEEVGSFDQDMKGQWWTVEVDDDEFYAINAAGRSAQDNEHRVGVFDAQSLEPVVESSDGFALFDAGEVESSEVLVTIADADGPIGENSDLAVSIAPVVVEPHQSSGSVEFIDGVRPVFIAMEHDDSGLSTAEAMPDAGDSAALRADIVEWSSLETVATETASEPLAAVARSGARDFVVAVIPDAVDGQNWEAQVEIELMGIDEALWLEAHEATMIEPLFVDTWPGAYRGDFDDIDVYNVFEIDLEADSRLWVLAMPGANTSGTDASPHIFAMGPGAEQHWNFDGGEGNFPALQAVPITSEGLWTVEFGSGVSNGFDSGEFVLYFLRR